MAASPLYDFQFNDFLAREYQFDPSGARPLCKDFQRGNCPLGYACPNKHSLPTRAHGAICKHWLRGLCKKGGSCEFLHEYNLRAMPECDTWARTLQCPNGADCLYAHPALEQKQPMCAHYDQGFCPLGPRCAARHAKRARICPFYMAGFCPDGRDCEQGAHPAWRDREELEKPQLKGDDIDNEEHDEHRQPLVAEMDRHRGENDAVDDKLLARDRRDVRGRQDKRQRVSGSKAPYG